MKLSHWLFAIAFLLPLCSFGQDRLLKSYGLTSLADVHSIPWKLWNNPSEGYPYKEGNYVSYLTLFGDLRLNLAEFSDNVSFSVSVMPTLAAIDKVESSLVKGVSFSMPFYLSFNGGACSTFRSLSRRGLGLSVGLEYMRPIFLLDFYDNVVQQRSYLLPMAMLSYRVFRPVSEIGAEWFILFSRSNVPEDISMENRIVWHAMSGLKWYWNY